MRDFFKNIISGISGSYSQVFFSDNRWLSLCLVLAGFVDPVTGICGLFSVLCAMGLAYLLGLNLAYTRNGWYTYNVLLTGMALGANFQVNATFIGMLVFSSVLCLFLSVWLSSVTSKYGIPFLSLPFIFSVWVVFLNVRSFQTHLIIERGPYACQDTYSTFFGQVQESLEKLGFHKVIILYFKSMASIFFQNSLVSGILISIGLIISSRIAFFLSWMGFLAGYVIYKFTYGPNVESDYFYTGFNYVFAAIALAGFYLVPSWRSYLLVLISVPLIALFNSALLKVAGFFFLPLYSLPFSLLVIVVISVLNNRRVVRHLDLVQYQLYSPEKNLYAFETYMERFKKNTLVHIHLPFYGEWKVSQGHSGTITHKEDWRYALDFVVTDEVGRTFKLPGTSPADFYCYSLPVLAPADGYVVAVEGEVEDNTIGDANLEDNWGNTIIIKHAEYLYSKLSHLKKDSIRVKVGDAVKRGEVIAKCGNSGRSPEPHIHFQLQATPYFGAPTLNYPISYYVAKKEEVFTFHSFDVPKEGEKILRPVPHPLIKRAFHFIPGMKLNFEVTDGAKTGIETWEVFTDAYNQSYLFCKETKSSAHFTNNETLFYFTGFNGSRKSLLYYFYLAAYKVVMCHLQGLEVKDRLPVETSRHRVLKPLQDLLAPFYIFMKPVYRSVVKLPADGQSQDSLFIHSRFSESEGNGNHDILFETELFENRINRIKITNSSICISAKRIA